MDSVKEHNNNNALVHLYISMLSICSSIHSTREQWYFLLMSKNIQSKANLFLFIYRNVQTFIGLSPT
jgi:hypothetical protein